MTHKNHRQLTLEITFAAMCENPALCGRLLAYLSAALDSMPDQSLVRDWIIRNLESDIAKIKESR
jgi:hypothetical protein